MTKYKSKFTGQQIDDGIEYGVRVTQQTLSSAQKQQARENIGAQEVVTDMAKLGGGIGTCSTSSGTALTVSLTGYELVTNGFVAVTFDYDVPAGATLNVNGKGAKPVYYKGAAIEADTIKADDTITFCYDGTNYVVTSLGGGSSAPVVSVETLTISLAQENGNNADIVGATIQVIDDDTSALLYNGLWQGNDISIDIESGVNYNIVVGSVSGYLTPSTQSYRAQPDSTREVEFVYNKSIGVYIEATDGTLMASSRWDSSKTANSIVIFTENCNLRVALDDVLLPINDIWNLNMQGYMTAIPNESDAKFDFGGTINTDNLIRFNIAHGTNTTSYAAPYCRNFTFLFPSGTKGDLPAFGQLWTMYQNKTEFEVALSTCGGSPMRNNKQYVSSTAQKITTDPLMWHIVWSSGNISADSIDAGHQYGVRPVSSYV